MANRLTQIATRTGDDGTTGLGDGSRVAKSHLRIAALGDVDELNSTPRRPPRRAAARRRARAARRRPARAVQPRRRALDPGLRAAEGRGGGAARRSARALQRRLPRLKEFILPAGTRSAALAHVGRTVARRAERAVVALGGERDGSQRSAPVPEPAERPAVRPRPRPQPRQPRRPRRRRRLLEERAAGPRRGRAPTTPACRPARPPT